MRFFQCPFLLILQKSSTSPFNSPSKINSKGDVSRDLQQKTSQRLEESLGAEETTFTDDEEDIDVTDPGSAGPGGVRRRAPRALTGRFVRPGTGASRETLAILRKKLLERLRLKELLGENSHLYFGALNKQKGQRKNIEAAKKLLAIKQ